jgi:hypothetical protein
MFVLAGLLSGCSHNAAIKHALLMQSNRRDSDCRDAELINTGRNDQCWNLPVYQLKCAGEVVISEAILCERGECHVADQTRCYK